MVWNSRFIEDIYLRRKQERDLAPEMAQREDSLLKLISRSLYGEKVHYALELIQNAEDADSSSITFIFEPNQIIVINDGGVFIEDDVDAICSVKPGRKKNKIGFFGVGFKSVFNVTNTPQVISSKFNFNIHNYIYPSPNDKVPESVIGLYSANRGSIFVLPQSDGLPSMPDLIENFKEIDDKILLFLSSLSTLHFIDSINGEKWSIEKAPTSEQYVLLKDGRTGKETKWRVFRKDLTVPSSRVPIPEGKEGITDTRIILAFPCDDDTIANNDGSTIYCYLPTKKRSDMPFLVQGDFVPTVGRADIQEIEWNKWLLDELGSLAAESMDYLKDDANLSGQIYSFIPLRQEVQEPLMDLLCEAMYDSLRDIEISKTLHDGWKRPSECVIALSDKIPHLVNQQDLAKHLKRSLSYIDVEMPERGEDILRDLGSGTFGEEEFIGFLNDEPIVAGKTPQWFLSAYEYLAEVFPVYMKDSTGNLAWNQQIRDLFSRLEKTRFLLTNRGSLVPLNDDARPDRLICFPQNIDLSETNQLLTEGEIVFLNKYFQLSSIIKRKEIDLQEEERRKKVRDFLDGIGVRVYFKQFHVIRDVLLPKYASGKYAQYDDQKLFRFVNYIRMYWPTLESEVKNKKISEDVFNDIRNTVLLRAYTITEEKRVACYMPPNKLYFPKRYGPAEKMEDLFAGIEGICFLHPYYLNREKYSKKKRRGRQKPEHGWKRFAEILGVWSSPIVEKHHGSIPISGDSKYAWVPKEYSPSGLHELSGDSHSEDLMKLIEYCSSLPNPDEVRERMNLLLQSFSDNWDKYREHYSAVYRYKYQSERLVPLNSSSFLNYLNNSKWIPTEEGDFCKPAEVYLATPTNRFLLGERSKYAKLPNSHGFLKTIGVNLAPSVSEVVEHLKEYKEGHPSLEKSQLPKFEAIYSFIAGETTGIGIGQALLPLIKNNFEDGQLLYIPRKDSTWWKPSEVFWRDQSKVFGNLRGYIEHEGREIYPPKVKQLFLEIGVPEQAGVEEALEMLEQLREKNDLEGLARVVIQVYSYINDLLAHDMSKGFDLGKFAFLTKDGAFHRPRDVYFEDDEDFSRYFYDRAKFISLPNSSWINFRHFLAKAGFNSFADSLSIKKQIESVQEVEGSAVDSIIRAIILTRKYLFGKNLDAFQSLDGEGAFDSLPSLDVFEASYISVDLTLRRDGQESTTVKGISREAYYSKEENRLYVLTILSLFSGIVAKELSKIFRWAGKEVFPFLNSILPVIEDDAVLKHQLSLFGLEDEDGQYEKPEKVEMHPTEEKAEEGEKTEQETGDKAEENKEVKKVTPPEPPKPRTGLLDPDEYYPSQAREFVPYKDVEGGENQVGREIILKKGKPGVKIPPNVTQEIGGRKDAEGTAIQIVLNYEAGEGRNAEDRHRQKGIGYDVYSKTSEGEEMFIEVKHFRESEGPFELKPHQAKKADIEREKYYIYIVKGLKQGTTPKILIIQDPIQWLTPDPPVQKTYSQWKNAVKAEIAFEKA